MRKLRLFSIILLLASTILFAGFQMYTKVVRDTKSPVVECETEELTVSVKDPVEKLFEGVTAKDKRSGDVSDTLVIEEMTAFTDKNTRVITYAAVDESKNVGRCERTLRYSDYQAPRFTMNKSLCFPMGDNVNIFDIIGAKSSLDGELGANIKYALEEVINTMEEGSYPIEFRVTDSAGKTVYLNTEIEILSREKSSIDVYLDEYLIYVKKGSSFNPEKYYKGAEQDGELTIKSKVDTDKAGTYYVDYILKSGAISGKSRLLVVVQ